MTLLFTWVNSRPLLGCCSCCRDIAEDDGGHLEIDLESVIRWYRKSYKKYNSWRTQTVYLWLVVLCLLKCFFLSEKRTYLKRSFCRFLAFRKRESFFFRYWDICHFHFKDTTPLRAWIFESKQMFTVSEFVNYSLPAYHL